MTASPIVAEPIALPHLMLYRPDLVFPELLDILATRQP